MIFSEQDRERIHDRVLEIAKEDARIASGAVVGSLALSDGDRWSDLDLTFAVADEFSVGEVLEDWTRKLAKEFDAIQLFDLPSGTSIYRVFLFPGCLQFDLSFTPASSFGAIGPKFRLLFGSTVAKPQTAAPSARELFGYAVHHALRARICIERGRYWQAEYWLSAARDYGLSLACRNRGLVAVHGRGFDDLPIEVCENFRRALPMSLQRQELLRALGGAIDGLLQESVDLGSVAARIEPQLRYLVIPWKS
jgi:predicted nucleotidyltransferase